MPVRPPRVLFVAENTVDYQADALHHGLVELLGDRVVDIPKRELMYDSFPRTRLRRQYGKGFTLHGLLPDRDVDRTSLTDRVRDGEFDLVVFGAIWRDFGTFAALLPHLRETRVAVVDGADSPGLYPWARMWMSHRSWWALPRASTRFPYFKRELTPWATSHRWYGVAGPPALSRHLPLPRNLRPISFAVPAAKIAAAPPAKVKDFAAHIVDPEVRAGVGGSAGYAFEEEADYVADLRASRFGVTTRRAGWDALRHYEIAAAGAVPCFRDLARKPATCAPHGLHTGNCVPYRSWRQLRERIAGMGEPEYAALQAGALAWAGASSTRVRAAELLGAVGLPGPWEPTGAVGASAPA